MTKNNDDQKPDYGVGYKRPPKHTQFKPGHSGGNRKGRPRKGVGNLATSVQMAASKTATVDKNGQKIRMQMRDFIASGIVTRAAKGSEKDIALLAKLDNALIVPSSDGKKSKAASQQTSKTIEEATASYREALQRARNPNE